MAWFETVASTQEGHASVSALVGVSASSTQEGYAGVGELLGYSSLLHDRTAYTSVSEKVTLEATSTREGHAGVSELLGFGGLFHYRTGYASVSAHVGIPLPETIDVLVPQIGWGTPLVPSHIVKIVPPAGDAWMDVSAQVGVGPAAEGERDGFTSVSEGNVVV